MANDRNYFSVFNFGDGDVYVKDAEARAAIAELDPATHASTSTCEDIISELT